MSQDDLAEKETNWVHTPAPRLRTDPPWIEATYPEKERTFEVFKANARYISYFNKEDVRGLQAQHILRFPCRSSTARTAVARVKPTSWAMTLAIAARPTSSRRSLPLAGDLMPNAWD